MYYRGGQCWDVRTAVLVIGIRVDNHIRTQAQACLNASHEGHREASAVLSEEPSSMMSHSTVSKPSTFLGRSARAMASVSASLRQGIWMMSFISLPWYLEMLVHESGAYGIVL